MKPHSQRFIQKRRFVMVLPVLVMPFLTVIFWALGGGQGTAASTTEKQKAGLNPELPNAQFDRDIADWDKLSLYQKAKRDSIKYNEAKRNDPYFKLSPLKGSQDTLKRPKSGSGDINPSLGKRDPWIDENEERVNQKLRELYKNLNASSQPERTPRYESESDVAPMDETPFSNDVEKLESMMEMMQSGGAEDEEMQEIQSVLNKILDIQHPERVEERLKAQRQDHPEQVFGVAAAEDKGVGLIGQSADSLHLLPVELNRFFGLDKASAVTSAPKSFEAEVYDVQTVISGSVIKLKLMAGIYVNGILIPENHFLYGVCALNGERLNVSINSIHYANQIFPVSLSVFDLDGLEGIYVPGAIARDVAKQSSNQAVQDIRLNSLNPSLEIQAASAGIETAKNLISKKTRLTKVMVKAGYKVLLVDTSNK
jgi:conjugative transposon TraM protein